MVLERLSKLNTSSVLALVCLVAISMLAISSFTSSNAQPVESYQLNDNDIIVVPIQLGRDAYGLAMVDKNKKNIWIYETNSRTASGSKLKLIAARNYKFDAMLEQYNSSDPSPEQVRMILEKFAAMELRHDNETEPNNLPEVEKNPDLQKQ